MKRGFFEVKEMALEYEREMPELPKTKDKYIFDIARRCFEAWSDVQEWLGRKGNKWMPVDVNRRLLGWNLIRLVENRIMEVDI